MTADDDIFSGRPTAPSPSPSSSVVDAAGPEAPVRSAAPNREIPSTSMASGPAPKVVLPPTKAPRHRKKAKKASPLRNFVEWVVIIAAALAVALVIKQFLVQAFYIPSESMQNTLLVGDRVLVNKMSYHLHDVHRGDIVVFKRPPAEAGEPAIKDLIKRVIGLPNDVIEARDGIVYVNDHAVKEPYLKPGSRTDNLPRQVVPPGKYFVMGDNRGNSKDARVFGPIPRSLIVGRAFVRVYPIPKFAWL